MSKDIILDKRDGQRDRGIDRRQLAGWTYTPDCTDPCLTDLDQRQENQLMQILRNNSSACMVVLTVAIQIKLTFNHIYLLTQWSS